MPVGWRRGYRLDVGWLVRPDQQNRTRGVVDNEARGRTQAVGPQTRAVTVARDYEKIGILGGANDFALDPSLAMDQLGTLAAKARRRDREQARRLLTRDLFDPAAGWVAWQDPSQ